MKKIYNTLPVFREFKKRLYPHYEYSLYNQQLILKFTFCSTLRLLAFVCSAHQFFCLVLGG